MKACYPNTMLLRLLLAGLVASCLPSCARFGTVVTPVASKVQVDASLIVQCEPLPLLLADGDPVLNHLQTTQLYHQCSDRHASLVEAVSGVVEAK